MKLFRPLQQTNKENWREAGIWLLYNFIGSLAPVWFGFLLLKIFSRNPSWTDFSQHGEFALYSAAMLAPAFYIINTDLKIPGFAGRQVLGLLTLVGVLLATCFFVAVTTAFMAPAPMLVIDQSFLRRWTVCLFVFSAVVAFLVNVLHNARLTPDVRGAVTEQENRLAQDFDKLGDKQ